MDGRQIQAARVLLGWSQAQLAEAAGVSIPTVKRAEGASKAKVSDDTMGFLRSALENSGVMFIPENGGGLGVRLLKRTIDE